ncbi:regulatory LuxR family protein [Saccharopolyspora erythraea NRRL 2338]|nr:helix-turn-helix transcriptional regulator [Saccharopolyspora erythraea]EQD82047.1 hypothetical protein N599_32810 [Saccharopolyspora erythraea D]PFG97975.1 regulatory LuxR family protein [Saccharopolyspora erythraea NRRL 2338]QRK88100.1 helix-turn-helix transcriptional regulator [Saccharopolyspora erythraea]
MRDELDGFGAECARPLWHYGQAELCLVTGRLAEAQQIADEGLDAAEDSANPLPQVLLRSLLVQVSIRRYELSLAGEHLSLAERAIAQSGQTMWPSLEWAKLFFAKIPESAGPAIDKLITVYSENPVLLLLLNDQYAAAPLLIRIADQIGMASKAEAVCAAVRYLASVNPRVSSMTGAAAHAQGVLRNDPELLVKAVEHYRSSARVLARAAAMEDAAVALSDSGDHHEAVNLLEEASAIYVDIGAQYDAVRVRKSSQRVGSRRSSRRGNRELGGWDSITDSELRVVQMVAQGLTNKQAAKRLFLSPYTVDSHLRHVFAKLGINSRVELARQVAARS